MSKALYSVYCWQISWTDQNRFIFWGTAEIVCYAKFGKPFISKLRVSVSHSTIQIQCIDRLNWELLKLIPVLVKLEPRSLNFESVWKPYAFSCQGNCLLKLGEVSPHALPNLFHFHHGALVGTLVEFGWNKSPDICSNFLGFFLLLYGSSFKTLQSFCKLSWK